MFPSCSSFRSIGGAIERCLRTSQWSVVAWNDLAYKSIFTGSTRKGRLETWPMDCPGRLKKSLFCCFYPLTPSSLQSSVRQFIDSEHRLKLFHSFCLGDHATKRDCFYSIPADNLVFGKVQEFQLNPFMHQSNMYVSSAMLLIHLDDPLICCFIANNEGKQTFPAMQCHQQLERELRAGEKWRPRR